MAEALKHNLKVATHIRKAIAAGVSMKVILDDIQKYNGAPTSMNGMYKTYRNDIAEARANLHEEMGMVVVNAAKGGDWKAAELVLRSKAGWSPTQTIVEATPEDEAGDTSAIDDLLALLGKSSNKKPQEES